MRNCYNTDVTFLRKINIYPILGIKKSFWELQKAYSDFPKGSRTVGKGKNACTLLP
jgi:hypothetical protein